MLVMANCQWVVLEKLSRVKLTSLKQVFFDDHVRNNPYSVWERGYVRCINWRKLRSALKVSFSFIFIFIYRFSFSFRELQELHELH